MSAGGFEETSTVLPTDVNCIRKRNNRCRRACDFEENPTVLPIGTAFANATIDAAAPVTLKKIQQYYP